MRGLRIKDDNRIYFESEYKKKLSEHLNCDTTKIFLYWKGRVALYGILKAMGVKAGDEVILQAYTCVVVANAILYLGAIPIYVDIDEATYNMNVELLESKITEKTKVIICQNTYGLSTNLEKIIAIAKKHKIYTVEDCTHGFGGFYNGMPNGSYCDAAFFSTQWSKPFTTGIGGFSVVHDALLKAIVDSIDRHKASPTFVEIVNLRVLYFVKKYIVNRGTYWALVKLYRLLSKFNFVLGSSSGEEISTIEMPKGYFKDISICQLKKGIKELGNFSDVQALRRKNAEAITAFLEINNKTCVKREFFKNNIFLRYPLLVKDREEFKEMAGKENIILGEWFDTPLYPVYENLEKWNFSLEEFPVSKKVCASVVNLETDLVNNYKVIDFLKNHLHLIL